MYILFRINNGSVPTHLYAGSFDDCNSQMRKDQNDYSSAESSYLISYVSHPDQRQTEEG